MVTPGGFRMSVAMTNCGSFGWVTDRTGYRYDAVAPESGHNWPRMPDSFLRLAKDAAAHVGFNDFVPTSWRPFARCEGPGGLSAIDARLNGHGGMGLGMAYGLDSERHGLDRRGRDLDMHGLFPARSPGGLRRLAGASR
jgi:2OG-Fe(II) oxygenase superfamily